jgi:hypothetical protein
MNSLSGEVCEGYVVVTNGPQARQDLRERRDNEVLGMPAKNIFKKSDPSQSHTVAGQQTPHNRGVVGQCASVQVVRARRKNIRPKEVNAKCRHPKKLRIVYVDSL